MQSVCATEQSPEIQGYTWHSATLKLIYEAGSGFPRSDTGKLEQLRLTAVSCPETECGKNESFKAIIIPQCSGQPELELAACQDV